MQDYAIIDDFLPQKDWQGIFNNVLAMDDITDCTSLIWRYSAYKTGGQKSTLAITDFQFVHMFFGDMADPKKGAKYSNDSHIVEPLIEKINPDSVERIKANLQTRVYKQKIDAKGFHTDQEPDNSGEKFNAVYYVNDNNGFTVFKDGTQVKSKANRLLVFKNELEHTGIAQSDTNVRVVINLTFGKKGGCLGVK